MNQPWIFDFSQGNLVMRVDWDAGGNAIYQGWAQPGKLSSDSAWRLIKNTYDGSNQFTQSAFAVDASGNPSCAFAFVWDNRASYVYA